MNGENLICRGKPDRQCFLDILRAAATCAVVLMHTLTGAVDAVDISQYPAERLVYLVVMDLITWCVPVFLLISGYLFLNPQRHISFSQMLKKYCRRVVLALILFGVPYAILELILTERTFRPAMIGQGLLMVLQGKSWSHMWYLYLILVFYLMTPALKWMLARLPRGCVYGILAVLLTGSSILPFLNKLLGTGLPALPDGGIYFFYYICGYLFACEKKCGWQELGEKQSMEAAVLHAGEKNAKLRESAKLQETVRTGAAACVLTALMFVGMMLSRALGKFSLQMAYNYPFTVLVSLLIFSIAKKQKIILGKKSAAIWQGASALSFTIYLVHPVFVNVLYKLLHISLLDFPIGISLPVFFVVILMLSAVVAWILCKIPVLKKYVL